MALFLRKAIGLLGLAAILVSCGPAGGGDTVTVAQIQPLLEAEAVFLLDVHIPEQRHIPGTDAFIDYRYISQNADRLPADKNTRIVVYCLGEGMSRSAVKQLAEIGYTNVQQLAGGSEAFYRLAKD